MPSAGVHDCPLQLRTLRGTTTPALKSLKLSAKGHMGQCVVMSDVGISRRRSHAELPKSLQRHRFMQHMIFPSTIPRALQHALGEYKESVPDIFMVQQMREETQYILVEIDHCRGTNPAGQQDRAYTQHDPCAISLSNMTHVPPYYSLT
jgi:hypothetical protein